MAEVFISYAREDRDFVFRLHEALNKLGRKDWVDWNDIPPTAKWMKEIQSAIESSDSYIFVISPDSLGSEVCHKELQYAIRHHKRLIPIVLRDPDNDKAVPEKLREINYLFFRENDDFETSFQKLVNAIDTDLDWVRSHTRLLTRAIEWESKDKNKSFLLQGNDLRAAEEWLSNAMDKNPNPTTLQTQYIIASRANSEQQKDVALKAFYKLTYDVPEMLAKYPGTAHIRKKFVTDTLQPLEDLVKLNERGSEFLRELATNYRLLGTILIELNELDEARKAFQKSADSCSELIVKIPNEALYHRDFAVSHYNIGVIFERQTKLAEANREYIAAYEPAKKAVELDPARWKEFFDEVESKISQSANNVSSPTRPQHGCSSRRGEKRSGRL